MLLAVITLLAGPAQAQTEPTATPVSGGQWIAQKTGQTEGPSIAGALLRVKVDGLTGLPIDIATITGVIGQSVTGSKPEDLPLDVAEFAGLTPGWYTIIPRGLGIEFTVELTKNTTVFVEFKPAPPPTATATATATPPPLPTSPPTMTPPPPKRWLMAIVQRKKTAITQPRLVVQVKGPADQALSLTSPDGTEQTCTTTVLPGFGRYACQFTVPFPGEYNLAWTAQMMSAPVQLNPAQQTLVVFKSEVVPAELTRWQGMFTQNSNQAARTSQSSAIIEVQVQNRTGQIVVLSDKTNRHSLCETDAQGRCRFSQLAAGIYTIAPANLNAPFSLFTDGAGQATVVFKEEPASSPAPRAEALTGQGAQPKKAQSGIGAVQATPTATATPSPAPTRSATATATAQPTQSAVVAPTATLTATLAPSPTPATTWLGLADQYYTHPGQTIVVQAPIDKQAVLLKSGPWQLAGVTGSKPEYGDFSAEFAGLSTGEYTVELVGLGSTTVSLEADHFMRVRFELGPVPTATPTPQPGWTAATLSNTSKPGDNGRFSILTIEVAGLDDLSVLVSTGGGFETTCITGTKPELGDGVCQIGGLGPADYLIQPEGLPVSHVVTLDGQGTARVSFWQQP